MIVSEFSGKSETSIRMAEDGNKDRKKPVTSLTKTDLICWAFQVACGMDYLVTKHVLHGDLAARNILLCDGNVVKICDFGLAQSIRDDRKCEKQKGEKLPVKWLALECIETLTFGTPSDIWAYGVMLWEFFSLAQVPYSGIAHQELHSKLRDGYRLPCPQYANQEIYDLMLWCWYVNPDRRPRFEDLSIHFKSMLPDELQEYYVNQNEPYMVMNAMKANKLEVDDAPYDGVPEGRAPSSPCKRMSAKINKAQGCAVQQSCSITNIFYESFFSFKKSDSHTTMRRNL